MTGNLLEICNLVAEFRAEAGIPHAVKGGDLSIKAGEALAVVGESGSG